MNDKDKDLLIDALMARIEVVEKALLSFMTRVANHATESTQILDELVKRINELREGK